MKRTHFLIFLFLFVAVFMLSNESLAREFVHYITLTGHENTVNSVTFSPDARTLASASMDRTVRFWDIETGDLARTLTRRAKIHSVAFSPDGQIVASGNANRSVELWKAETGSSLRSLNLHRSTIHSVAFSRDGGTLASGSMDRTIRLWNVKTGRPLSMRALPGHASSVMSVAFHPVGLTFASAGSDKAIKLWNAQTGAPLRTFTADAKVWSVAFSPDGQTLAAASADRKIGLWDVNTGRLLQTFTGHSGAVHSVAFSPDGQTLATASADDTVCLWDVSRGTQQETLGGHTKDVMSVAFSPDGYTLASGSMDTTIRLWRAPSAKQIDTTDTETAPKKIEPKKDIVDPTIEPKKDIVDPTNEEPRRTPANRIYNDAIHGVVWIVNPWVGDCNGVLIDKHFKLVATHAHITGTQDTIDVYFPVSDENDALIEEPNFYLTNRNSLKRRGYFSNGHVVAKSERTNLAIIRLDEIPENAREINWHLSVSTPRSRERVYNLGNPGGHELWWWTLGVFLKDDENSWRIQAHTVVSNLGSPVLNQQNVLIGIVSDSDGQKNASVIPVRDIRVLLSESKLMHSQ